MRYRFVDFLIRVESLVSLAIIVGGALVKINALMSLSWPEILGWLILASVAIFPAAWLLGYLFRIIFQGKFAKFYANQAALPDIGKALLRTDIVWAAWPEGRYATFTRVFDKRKIEKLVLLDPEGSNIEAIAAKLKRTVENIKSSIELTTERAQDGKVASPMVRRTDSASYDC